MKFTEGLLFIAMTSNFGLKSPLDKIPAHCYSDTVNNLTVVRDAYFSKSSTIVRLTSGLAFQKTTGL